MATIIQRIEKDFLLGMLRYREIPIKCYAVKNEYVFIIQAIHEEQIIFKSQNDLSVFRKNMKIDLKFSVQSVLTPIISFSVYICSVGDHYLITTVPEYLYKNLQRSYSRVPQPPDLNIIIKKDGFYYDLDYEKLNTTDTLTPENNPQDVSKENIDTQMDINLDWIKQKADGYKLVLFKDQPPVSIEEKAVGKLGKILYISMPDGGFISEPDNTMGLFFTENSLREFLVNSGMNHDVAGEKILEILRERAVQGICSDCFIPVVFLSYIVGYVHIWVYEGGNVPLTITMIEKIRQFTSIIAFFLEHEHFFEEGKKRLPSFNPKLLDISASGFLFALDLNKAKAAYVLNDTFSVKITISDRVIQCKAVIARDYTERKYAFYGCKFVDMELEDIRFLFESIYGKPFTDKDLEFITGSV
jgi:hypothetical protein